MSGEVQKFEWFSFFCTKLFEKRGHYSRGDIIQGRTLFKEIRYLFGIGIWIWAANYLGFISLRVAVVRALLQTKSNNVLSTGFLSILANAVLVLNKGDFWTLARVSVPTSNKLVVVVLLLLLGNVHTFKYVAICKQLQ